jgi:RNA polymerase sigma-70 factor (ECF subfamily)
MADFVTPDEISLARYREYLRSLARIDPRLRPEIDPSDIVQEALLRAQRGLGQFRGHNEQQLAAWLRVILANTMRNALRALGRRNGEHAFALNAALEQSSAQADAGLADDQLPPEEIAARNEELLRLAEALARLPDDQRGAVEMKHLQGCSVAQIAELTGRSKPSVVGLLYRGIKALRVLLERPGHEPGPRPGLPEEESRPRPPE